VAEFWNPTGMEPAAPYDRATDFYNTHQPHRALKQAAPLRRLPGNVIDLERIRVQRCDRAGGVIHQYRLVA
jgi:putative transposase